MSIKNDHNEQNKQNIQEASNHCSESVGEHTSITATSVPGVARTRYLHGVYLSPARWYI